jgi:hypothetical protein
MSSNSNSNSNSCCDDKDEDEDDTIIQMCTDEDLEPGFIMDLLKMEGVERKKAKAKKTKEEEASSALLSDALKDVTAATKALKDAREEKKKKEEALLLATKEGTPEDIAKLANELLNSSKVLDGANKNAGVNSSLLTLLGGDGLLPVCKPWPVNGDGSSKPGGCQFVNEASCNDPALGEYWGLFCTTCGKCREEGSPVKEDEPYVYEFPLKFITLYAVKTAGYISIGIKGDVQATYDVMVNDNMDTMKQVTILADKKIKMTTPSTNETKTIPYDAEGNALFGILAPTDSPANIEITVSNEYGVLEKARVKNINEYWCNKIACYDNKGGAVRHEDFV